MSPFRYADVIITILSPLGLDSVQVNDMLVLMIQVHIKPIQKPFLEIVELKAIKYKNRKIISMSSEVRHDLDKIFRYIQVFVTCEFVKLRLITPY